MRKTATKSRRTPGQPKAERSLTSAQKVSSLRAAGYSVERIASVTGLSQPVLLRLYSAELESGHEIARAEVILAMYARAIGGSTAAARAYLALSAKPENKEPEAPKEIRAPWSA